MVVQVYKDSKGILFKDYIMILDKIVEKILIKNLKQLRDKSHLWVKDHKDEIIELVKLQVKKYIEEHQIEQYVILDDELIEEELQEHQVFLDLYRGLQEEHIIPALNILNGNLGFYPPNYDRNETPEELNSRINSYYSKARK